MKQLYEIKNRYTSVTLFAAECESMRECVEKAAEARAYLAGAYLADAYLADANLTGAYLAGANLTGAYLAGAKDADLAIAKTRILPEGDIIGWKKCRDT